MENIEYNHLWKPPRWSWPLVFLLAILAYQPALRNSLTFDDIAQVSEFEPPSSLNGWVEAAFAPWVPGVRVKNHWRPVPRLSILAQKAVLQKTGSESLRSFYAFNILLHACVALMLLALASHLIGFEGGLAAALIFAVHPLIAEPVHQIVGRAELFAAFFMLLGIFLFCRRGTTPHAYWQQPLCFALALASKEHAILYPFYLWLTIMAAPIRVRGVGAREDHERLQKRKWRIVLAVYATLLAVAAAFFYVRGEVAGSLVARESVLRSENPMVTMTLPQRLPIAVGVFGYAVTKFFIPTAIPPDFSAHSFPIELGWQWPWAWAGNAMLVLLLAILCLSFLQGRSGTTALILGGLAAWFITSSLPFINGAMAARRWWYFPAMFLCVAAGVGIREISGKLYDPRRKVLQPLILGTVCLLLMSANWRGSIAWRSMVDHAQTTLDYFPHNSRALTTMAYWYFEQEAYEGGAAFASQATMFFPENARGWMFLGQNEMMIPGRAAEAENAFRRTIVLDPRLKPAYRNLATVLQMQGRTTEAAAVLESANGPPNSSP